MDTEQEMTSLRKTNGCADSEAPADNVTESSTLTSSSGKNSTQDDERGVWANKIEFFLAIMGYTVGIGSVWRFPIICSRNGGGAFLIPFFFFLATAGGPLYYLEVCLGQFSGKSAGLSFEFCPLFKGLGLLQVTLSLTVLWYLVIILAWVFYFLYNSFFPVLPWTTCGNDWNTVYCRAITGDTSESDVVYTINGTTQSMALLGVNETKYQSSAYEFWEYKAVGRSSGLDDLGSLQPHLVLCFFLGWFTITLAIIKGVKTLGKVVYVTATAPYVLLTIMFIKGLTLDGAMDGIRLYVTPDFSKLLTIQVWLEAAIQVFYSLGPAWGGVITMASYNRFHQKSFWSCVMCVFSAGFTSFYNGLVVFTLLGFMAHQAGMSVEEAAKQSGPGLAFVAFPTAISQMPVPNLWAVLFFLTLVTVMFDSMFGMLETVTSGIIDFFPEQLVKRRVLVNIITGMVFFLSGLPLTLNGGIYIFQLSDWYFSQFGLLVGSFLELLGICWIYGMERFSQDISLMTGRDVSVVLRVFWAIVIPVFTVITFLTMLSQYSAPNYGDGYEYSSVAIAFGIGVGMIPIVGVISVAGWVVYKAEGSLVQRIRSVLKPSPEWKPNDVKAQRVYTMKNFASESTWRRRFVMNIRGVKENPII